MSIKTNRQHMININRERWVSFYRSQLINIVFQLFEWEGLPLTIDPFFFEKSLHTKGYIAVHRDTKTGIIQAYNGGITKLNRYERPTEFSTSMLNEKSIRFPVLAYDEVLDVVKEEEKTTGMGLICQNNFTRSSTVKWIELFARQMAEIKQISLLNLSAQKMPFIIEANDDNLLTLQNVYYKIEANEPVILTHEGLLTGNKDTIKVHNNNVPLILEDLNKQRLNEWNEFLNSIGIDNMNISKNERMIVAEATSNDELINNNRNTMLSPRQEFSRLYSEMYQEEISVKVRSSIATKLAEKGEDLMLKRGEENE